jgi:heme-degrading monooxygenase HmoA
VQVLLRRVTDNQAHFPIITRWQSWEAFHRFAGEDLERALYYPEDENYLHELEPHVTHYELAGEL